MAPVTDIVSYIYIYTFSYIAPDHSMHYLRICCRARSRPDKITKRNLTAPTMSKGLALKSGEEELSDRTGPVEGHLARLAGVRGEKGGGEGRGTRSSCIWSCLQAVVRLVVIRILIIVILIGTIVL